MWRICRTVSVHKFEFIKAELYLVPLAAAGLYSWAQSGSQIEIYGEEKYEISTGKYTSELIQFVNDRMIQIFFIPFPTTSNFRKES